VSAKILDGTVLAKTLKNDLKKEVAALQVKTGRVPRLINIMIGKDLSSCAYAKSQKSAAEFIGINYEMSVMPDDATEQEIISRIKHLNGDETVNGIMIHKPLPENIDYNRIANYVDTIKDLEGINVANIGRMILGETKIIPCTPASVMEHVRSTGLDLYGKEAVVIGHSEIVGKPLSLLLLQEFVTVTVCHVATSEVGHLEDHVARADILVVAVGKPSLVKGAWIKEGAIVIDVGINSVNGKIVGDVEFEQAKEKASFITPVPGGVGPVTVVMLMRNGIEAFKAQLQMKGEQFV